MTSVAISAPALDARLNVSGVSMVTLQIINALKGEVTFNHIHVGSTTGLNLGRAGGPLRSFATALQQILRDKSHVYHSNTALNVKSIIRDLALCCVARMQGKPILLHLHGGKYLHERPGVLLSTLIRALIANATKVLALSHTEQCIISERYPKHARKISFLYNSVQLPRSERPERVSTELNVAFAGRLVPEKGVKTLLELVDRFRGEGTIKFHVYGDGPLRDQICASAKLNSQLRYGGVFALSDGCTILGANEVVLLPSLSGEGMPMVLVEAMASGVVPVSTPLASIPEIIVDGQTGFLVPAGDVDACERVLRGLLSNPDELTRVSRATAAFARAHFDSATNSMHLAGVYRSIAAQPHQAS